MKTKSRIGALIGITFSFLTVGMSFQNCAQQTDFASLEEVTASGGSLSSESAASLSEKSQSDIEESPLDAKQTLESMMSLLNLGRGDINMNEVNSEINYRRNLLVSKSDLNLVNSPSIIAITSLAGVVCKQAVAKEKKMADLFKFLNFSAGPASYGKLGAINTFVRMADRFWLRKPTTEELALISQAVDEYYATLDAAALANPAETDKLAVFICSGMLALPESYLL